MKIRIDNIERAPEPIRESGSDIESMESLVNSIKELGLLSPIKVRPISDDMYEVVYGHRRLEACYRAGLEEIEAIVQETDDVTQHQEALAENVVREDMTPYEIALALRKETLALKAAGYTDKQGRHYGEMTEVGRKYGMDRRAVSSYLTLLRPEYEPISDRSEIGVRHVKEAEAGCKYRRYNEYDELKEFTDYELAAKVLEKAVKEELSIAQTRRAAEVINNLDPDFNQEGREELLEKPFDDWTDYERAPVPGFEPRQKHYAGDFEMLANAIAAYKLGYLRGEHGKRLCGLLNIPHEKILAWVDEIKASRDALLESIQDLPDSSGKTWPERRAIIIEMYGVGK